MASSSSSALPMGIERATAEEVAEWVKRVFGAEDARAFILGQVSGRKLLATGGNGLPELGVNEGSARRLQHAIAEYLQQQIGGFCDHGLPWTPYRPRSSYSEREWAERDDARHVHESAHFSRARRPPRSGFGYLGENRLRWAPRALQHYGYQDDAEAHYEAEVAPMMDMERARRKREQAVTLRRFRGRYEPGWYGSNVYEDDLTQSSVSDDPFLSSRDEPSWFYSRSARRERERDKQEETETEMGKHKGDSDESGGRDIGKDQSERDPGGKGEAPIASKGPEQRFDIQLPSDPFESKPFLCAFTKLMPFRKGSGALQWLVLKNSRWFDDNQWQECIYVRECYYDLARLIIAAYEAQYDTIRTFCVNGSPGVGKSGFAGFLLHLLNEKMGVPVVYRGAKLRERSEFVRPADGGFAFFPPRALPNTCKSDQADKLLARKQTVFLVDGAEPKPCAAFKVYISSSSASFELREQHRSLTVPPWTLAELQAGAPLKLHHEGREPGGLMADEIEERFLVWGGSPRNVFFAKGDSVKQVCEIKLLLERLVCQGIQGAAGQLDRSSLIHLTAPLDDQGAPRYDEVTIVPASSLVASELAVKCKPMLLRELPNLVANDVADTALGRLCSMLFEQMAFERLTGARSGLHLRSLQGESRITTPPLPKAQRELDFPMQLNSLCDSQTGDVPEQTLCTFPRKRRHSLDAVVLFSGSESLLIVASLSSKRGVRKRAIDAVRTALPKVKLRLCFLVPREIEPRFTAQPLLDEQGKPIDVSGGASLMPEQFVAAVDLEPGHAHPSEPEGGPNPAPADANAH